MVDRFAANVFSDQKVDTVKGRNSDRELRTADTARFKIGLIVMMSENDVVSDCSSRYDTKARIRPPTKLLTQNRETGMRLEYRFRPLKEAFRSYTTL